MGQDQQSEGDKSQDQLPNGNNTRMGDLSGELAVDLSPNPQSSSLATHHHRKTHLEIPASTQDTPQIEQSHEMEKVPDEDLGIVLAASENKNGPDQAMSAAGGDVSMKPADSDANLEMLGLPQTTGIVADSDVPAAQREPNDTLGKSVVERFGGEVRSETSAERDFKSEMSSSEVSIHPIAFNSPQRKQSKRAVTAFENRRGISPSVAEEAIGSNLRKRVQSESSQVQGQHSSSSVSSTGSRRSWFQRTPLSTKINPPNIRIGSEQRHAEFLWNSYEKFRLLDRPKDLNTFMFGWDEAKQYDQIRTSSPSAFLTNSPRTAGFPLGELKRAEEDPAPGQYTNWSSIDSKTKRAVQHSFSRSNRTVPLYSFSQGRSRQVVTAYGPTDQSEKLGGELYSGFQKQHLSSRTSSPIMSFSHSARKGVSARHQDGLVPGPGEYDLNIKSGPKKDVLAKTRLRGVPTFSVPKEKRPWQTRTLLQEKFPFPNSFSRTNLEDPTQPQRLAKFTSPPNIKFGTTQRMVSRPSPTPGPGSYWV